MMGAEIAPSWPAKFTMPPRVPTLSRGAISEGTVQATGAAAASPPSEMLIHSSADVGLCARAHSLAMALGATAEQAQAGKLVGVPGLGQLRPNGVVQLLPAARQAGA